MLFRSTFMKDGQLDSQRFHRDMGLLMRQAASRGQPVHATGNLVSLLMEDGLATTALRLEELWNELSRHHNFTMLCGYARAPFTNAATSKIFDQLRHPQPRRHGLTRPHRHLRPTAPGHPDCHPPPAQTILAPPKRFVACVMDVTTQELVLGTPLAASGTRVMLLGSGELGKEVAIELQRFGCEVTAVDRYANAPAMQVAHRSHVINMLDGQALRALVEQERPRLIVPEIEAIATSALVELEAEGFTVIPTARAARLTMDREGIRTLAAETLGLKTSPYRFADTKAEYREAVRALGMPCVVKPVMSSSGKGQSLVRTAADVDAAWLYAQQGGRAGGGRIIVEGFVKFDYEITLLTVRHNGRTSFCDPIGHLQIDGDYRESWQPQAMSAVALAESQRIAAAITRF